MHSCVFSGRKRRPINLNGSPIIIQLVFIHVSANAFLKECEIIIFHDQFLIQTASAPDRRLEPCSRMMHSTQIARLINDTYRVQIEPFNLFNLFETGSGAFRPWNNIQLGSALFKRVSRRPIRSTGGLYTVESLQPLQFLSSAQPLVEALYKLEVYLNTRLPTTEIPTEISTFYNSFYSTSTARIVKESEM